MLQFLGKYWSFTKGGILMGIMNHNGREVPLQVIVEDAITRRLTITQVIENRRLRVGDEQEFLEVFSDKVADPAILRKTQKAFETNVKYREKAKRKVKQKVN